MTGYDEALEVLGRNDGSFSSAVSVLGPLPPLPSELLGDVAEALGQLEEDRRQLEEYQALARAIGRFEQRYRVYAGTQSRQAERDKKPARRPI